MRAVRPGVAIKSVAAGPQELLHVMNPTRKAPYRFLAAFIVEREDDAQNALRNRTMRPKVFSVRSFVTHSETLTFS